jgi:hypothetical protein
MVHRNWFSLQLNFVSNEPPGTFLSEAVDINTVLKYRVKFDVSNNSTQNEVHRKGVN